MPTPSESLSEQFQNWNLNDAFGPTILRNLSSKYDNRIFPPYIPFMGNHFDQFKILVYCTAQNISKNSELVRLYNRNFEKLSNRLYYGNDFFRHYGNPNFNINDVDIAPFEAGVIPALIAIFILAKYSQAIPPNEIIHYCGVSNYYKFSLNSGSKDLNPEDDKKLQKFISDSDKYRYWALNDELVKRELEVLRPNEVLSFNGYKIRMLATHSVRLNYKLYSFSDPSWILHGANGISNWEPKYTSLNQTIKNFIDEYANLLSGRYNSKKERVKWFLAHYYEEWT